MTLSAWNSIQYDLFTYHGWLAQSIFNIRGTKKSLRSKNLWDSWPCYLSGSLQNISRIWGQSPKRQNVVFSQFSTINALGERQWLPRDLIWRIKFLSKSATDLCWTDVVVQSCYCWESLGHELCVLLHIHVLQRISHLITYKLFLLMANGIRNTHKEYIWIVWGKNKPLQ